MTQRPHVQAGVGELPVRMVSSILADEASAWYLANLILARWGDDSAWESPTVIVRHQLLSPAERTALAALEPGDELVTGGMGVAPGTPGAGRWRVEGWQETWDRGGEGAILRTQQFAVSDAMRWRSDPGQLTRTAVVLVSQPPYVYPASPLTIRFDVVPADSQPPERPMDGPVTIKLDGRQVGVAEFKGKPVTYLIGEQIGAGAHTITVEYGGPWGIWADSSASVDITVAPLPLVPVLTVDPAGPLGASPVLTVACPGLLPGHYQEFRVMQATVDEPDVWRIYYPETRVRTGAPVQLAALAWARHLKLVPTGGSRWGDYEVAESNVVFFGRTWESIAVTYATWQHVADTHSTWADVAARG